MGFTNRILELVSTNQLAKFLDYDRKYGGFEMLLCGANSIDVALTDFKPGVRLVQDVAWFVQGLYGWVRLREGFK